MIEGLEKIFQFSRAACRAQEYWQAASVIAWLLLCVMRCQVVNEMDPRGNLFASWRDYNV